MPLVGGVRAPGGGGMPDTFGVNSGVTDSQLSKGVANLSQISKRGVICSVFLTVGQKSISWIILF